MTNQNEMHFTRRIGNTTYKVRVVIPTEGQDTMEDKILRIIKNETGFAKPGNDITKTHSISRPA